MGGLGWSFSGFVFFFLWGLLVCFGFLFFVMSMSLNLTFASKAPS